MKILVCDDDKFIVQELNQMLSEYANLHKYDFVIEAFCSASDVCSCKNTYDMALIDIEMPGINGLKLANRIKALNKNTLIFIVTSHAGYLDEAMDLEVFRYISKPIDKDRLFRCLDKAMKRLKSNTRKVVLECADEFYSVYVNDIIYITTEGNKSIIVTVDNKYLSGKRLRYWKDSLKGIGFFAQPHHSYFVNLKYVEEFNKIEIILKSGKNKYKVPLSQRGYPEFKKLYFSYIGG